MNTTQTVEILNPREIRHHLGLNQQQFWSRINVTQSGGSRYESGRNMPKPVRELLRLVHVEQIDIYKLKGEDVEVTEYLKKYEPDLFKSLKKQVKEKKRSQEKTGKL
jgi:transcriptional regulator with XRE-family HTH domain